MSRHSLNLRSWSIAILMLFSISLMSQNIISNTTAKKKQKWYQQHVELKENSIFKNLPWQHIGPTNISGRMTDVEVVTPKGKNYTIYVATASGGIWKTQNEGYTWDAIFEHGMSTAFGDLALDPQNQEVIWAGTGEQNIFRSSQSGAGIYKSENGGESWEHKGLMGTGTISRIIVHPTNSNIVYVAASGNEWTDNKERGLYKTTDGGNSWKKVFYIDSRTAINDLILDPSQPETIYISSWQRIRLKWNDPRVETGYKNSGIYKSTDGGKNWSELTKGLPKAEFRGRIGIDLCKTKPNVIYAFVDNYEQLEDNDAFNDAADAYGRPSSGRIKGASLFKSTDAGASWAQVNEQNSYMEGMSGTYGWVFGQMRVDPIDENKVYLMGLALNQSIDGGKTFEPLRGMHGDHHGLWIDPDNTDYLVNVNDGGLAISYDGGKNFKAFYNEIPVVQFFNLNYDMATPFNVYGSIQDHGSRKGKVDLSNGRNKIPAGEFSNAPGGEGSNHFIDPTNADIVYSAGFYGVINRTNLATGDSKNIMPPTPEGVDKLRGQWLAPFILSPHNPRILYHGTQFVHRSLDQGESWEKISPDLTYNNEEMKGDIPYQTIFSLSESAKQFGLIYAGTDDGRVWITKDHGNQWKEINKGLPYRKWVSQIEASKFDKATVYLAQNGKRDDDFAPYLWKSTDFGESWIDITNDIPIGPINVIREDPHNANILYVGSDYGVYVSLDYGDSWNSLAGDFPTTYVHDLIIHPRDHIMVAATHGRGMWALDVSYIQAMNDGFLEKECSIYKIENSKLPYSSNWWYVRNMKKANIAFYLKNAASIELQILNESGTLVKTESIEASQGLNFYEWDLNTVIEGKSELTKAGNHQIIIKGESFEEKKTLKVDPYN